MTAAKKREIRRIAKSVRSAFEMIARNGGWDQSLSGLCYRSAIQVFLECRRHGIYVRLAKGAGHGFCVYSGHIIDVTATQFGKEYPKVVIIPIPKAPPDHHRIHCTSRSVKSFYIGGTMALKADKKVVAQKRART
jgi:hypothetical protein